MIKASPLPGGLPGAGLIGTVMLIAPEAWDRAMPGVTTTGPVNPHVPRDLGPIFLLIGVGFVYGAVRSGAPVLLWSLGALWLSGHALFHLWEVAVGICGPEVLPRDVPAVTRPARVAVALRLWSVRHAGR